MTLLNEIEDRYYEGLIFREQATLQEADSFYRYIPAARNMHDTVIFRLTAFPCNEGSWDVFTDDFVRYSTLLQKPGWVPPQLVPLPIVDAVLAASRKIRRRDLGEEVVDGSTNTSVAQRDVAVELLNTLGNAPRDALFLAGLRVRTQVLAARINDGFVHPVIGAMNLTSILQHRPDPNLDKSLIRELERLEFATREWLSDRARRPEMEVDIKHRSAKLAWSELERRAPGAQILTPPE